MKLIPYVEDIVLFNIRDLRMYIAKDTLKINTLQDVNSFVGILQRSPWCYRLIQGGGKVERQLSHKRLTTTINYFSDCPSPVWESGGEQSCPTTYKSLLVWKHIPITPREVVDGAWGWHRGGAALRGVTRSTLVCPVNEGPADAALFLVFPVFSDLSLSKSFFVHVRYSHPHETWWLGP